MSSLSPTQLVAWSLSWFTVPHSNIQPVIMKAFLSYWIFNENNYNLFSFQQEHKRICVSSFEDEPFNL